MNQLTLALAALTVAVNAPLAAGPGGAVTRFLDHGPTPRITPVGSMRGRGEIRGSSSDTNIRSDGFEARTVSSGGSPRAVARGAPPATPAPSYAFSSGTSSTTRVDIGGSPADSNLAASHTHVCITTRAAFACYTKGGMLVKPGVGLAARPYTAADLFAASGLPIAAAFDGSTSDASVAKDGRIVFDQIRARFFMVFQTREARARLMIAVSKSQDPRDGWWTYADEVGTATYPLQDYQWLGINASYLLVSDRVCRAPGDCPLHKHFLYPAAKLAAGQPYTRSVWTATGSNYAVPCDHDTNTTDA